MSIQEYAAAAIETGVAGLIRVAEALPEDKREWKPLEKGRTALHQIAECAVINELSACVLETGIWQADIPVMNGPQVAALDTFDKALAELQESATHLTQAIRNTLDPSLNTRIELPWADMTKAQIFSMPLWNMAYHEGQINYIASLAEQH